MAESQLLNILMSFDATPRWSGKFGFGELQRECSDQKRCCYPVTWSWKCNKLWIGARSDLGTLWNRLAWGMMANLTCWNVLKFTMPNMVTPSAFPRRNVANTRSTQSVIWKLMRWKRFRTAERNIPAMLTEQDPWATTQGNTLLSVPQEFSCYLCVATWTFLQWLI